MVRRKPVRVIGKYERNVFVSCIVCKQAVSKSNVSKHVATHHNYTCVRHKWFDPEGKPVAKIFNTTRAVKKPRAITRSSKFDDEDEDDEDGSDVYESSNVLQCLEPRRWMNDDALEVVVKFYISRDFANSKIELVPIALAKAWRDGFVEKPTSPNIVQSDLTIIILHSERGGGHWSCVFLDPKTKTIGHMDSMEDWHRKMAFDFGKLIYRGMKIAKPIFKELQCGRQVNSFDCGVHVVYNIRAAVSQFFHSKVQLAAVRGVTSIDSNRSRREIIKDLSPSIKKEASFNVGISKKKKPTNKAEERVSSKVIKRKNLPTLKKKASSKKSAATGTTSSPRVAGGPLIQCNFCLNWYHTANLKFSKRQISNITRKNNFQCDNCKSGDLFVEKEEVKLESDDDIVEQSEDSVVEDMSMNEEENVVFDGEFEHPMIYDAAVQPDGSGNPVYVGPANQGFYFQPTGPRALIQNNQGMEAVNSTSSDANNFLPNLERGDQPDVGISSSTGGRYQPRPSSVSLENPDFRNPSVRLNFSCPNCCYQMMVVGGEQQIDTP